uniref:Uncharacterized protein n=1 Tax=Knipowitschia caucasica TaxID=637954 RepID=A0AAV2LUG9_KNICA
MYHSPSEAVSEPQRRGFAVEEPQGRGESDRDDLSVAGVQPFIELTGEWTHQVILQRDDICSLTLKKYNITILFFI